MTGCDTRGGPTLKNVPKVGREMIIYFNLNRASRLQQAVTDIIRYIKRVFMPTMVCLR